MRKHYPAAFAAALVALVAARAWTCDDAFITFRVVEQLLSGAGPVFNEGERVQVFTHPLWLFVLAAWHVTGASLFPGAMVLSVALFALALGFLCAAFREKPAALAIGFTAMFLCRPIVDFATGGLETPATLLLFAAALWAIRTDRARVALGLLALLPLNRLDLLPWVLPFAWLCAGRSWRSRAGTFACLAAPALVWMVFSTVYYGSPLPNTALAKLGRPWYDRVDDGLGYVAGSFANDAGSLALLFVAPVVAFRGWRSGGAANRDRELLAATSAASVIGLGYAVWTGGDFMLGRFTLPTLWSFAVMLMIATPDPPASAAVRSRFAAATLFVFAAAHLLTAQSTLALWLDLRNESLLRAVGFAGATDERRVYLPWLGAYAEHRVQIARAGTTASSQVPQVTGMLGQNGYLAPRDEVMADIFALADPFLARVRPLRYGRQGHEFRPLPAHWELWRDPGHRFDDARLDGLASDLRSIHRSPVLWEAARWRAMLRVFLGEPIDFGWLSVRDEGPYRDFSIVASKLYRPFASESYVVWLRQIDASRLKYGMAFPHGLDGDCKAIAVSPEASENTGIVVLAGRRLDLRCSKASIGRDGVLMRIGAWMTDHRGPHVEYDQAIPLVRPVAYWVAGIPEWVVQGWREDPEPALVTAFALMAAAGGLLWFGRR